MTTAGDPLDNAAAFVRPADVIARRLGESAVLIRMRTSRIYQLNVTGARIWELLQQHASRDAVLDELLAEFEVSREDAATAVDHLIADLRAEGLL
ncbi:MAG: PqqD family protein [Acidobacteria bacterium]|nr:PqqD family protein [Acidobacteriota bacterium]